jgi:hypothetical protein
MTPDLEPPVETDTGNSEPIPQHEPDPPQSKLTTLYATDLEIGIRTGDLWKIRRSSTQLETVLADLNLGKSLGALTEIQRTADFANLTALPSQFAQFIQILRQESGTEEAWPDGSP